MTNAMATILRCFVRALKMRLTGRLRSRDVPAGRLRPRDAGRRDRPLVGALLEWGVWIALSHQRVVENDDGTITLLYLN
jgi:hypothetical protein